MEKAAVGLSKGVANANLQEPWSLKMVAPLEPGIVCIDINKMLKFYTEVLGLKFVSDAQTTPEMSTKFGTTPDGYRIIRLQTPRGERLKLVQPKIAPAKNPVPEWVFKRQGIAYLTFVISNIEEVVARLRAQNVKLISDGPVEIRPGILALFTLDPEGNFVEFVELRG